jgi:hypothetical protein
MLCKGLIQQPRGRRLILAIHLPALCLMLGTACAGQHARCGYTNRIPPESATAREARHKKVAERRAGPMALVHRGAWAFAPENTLEAYAAAMDYGLDGAEIDLRRTADGVVICMHDEWLDRLTDSWDVAQDRTYYDLLGLGVHSAVSAVQDGQFATFAALLILARQRAMLLHLDIKVPDIEDDIARMLDEADAWDQVVCINEGPIAMKIRANPKYKQANIKTVRLGYDATMSPELVKEIAPRPGECTVVDDPRLMARELNRPAYKPVPLPRGLYSDWQPKTAPVPQDGSRVPSAYVDALSRRINPNSEAQLMTRLNTRRLERIQPDGSEEYQRMRTERILDRAWAAQRLGRLGRKSPKLVKLLEYQVLNRSLHRDWLYHAVDGICAARALADLGAVESAPMLIDVFNRDDPLLSRIAGPEDTKPYGWLDSGLQYQALITLGDLRCDGYLTADEAAAKKIPDFKLEAATLGVMNQDLTAEEIEGLLKHPSAIVRGAAILKCLDHPSPARIAALKAVTPWVLDLPAAPHGRSARPAPWARAS